MYAEFQFDNIERIIEGFLSKHKIEKDFKVIKSGLSDLKRRSIMSYNMFDKAIYYDPHRVYRYYRDFPFFTPKEFVLLAFLHELGHHYHWKSPEHYKLLNIRKNVDNDKTPKEIKFIFEMGAWDHGRRFVPNELKEKYELLNKINILMLENGDKSFLVEQQLQHYISLGVDNTLNTNKTNINKEIKWSKSWSVRGRKADVVEKVLHQFDANVNDITYYENEYMIVVVTCLGRKRMVTKSLHSYQDMKVTEFV